MSWHFCCDSLVLLQIVLKPTHLQGLKRLVCLPIFSKLLRSPSIKISELVILTGNCTLVFQTLPVDKVPRITNRFKEDPYLT